MISKGTKVEIRTDNGGIVVGVLDHDYRPTYPVTILASHGYVCLMGWRVASVEVRS